MMTKRIKRRRKRRANKIEIMFVTATYENLCLSEVMILRTTSSIKIRENITN